MDARGERYNRPGIWQTPPGGAEGTKRAAWDAPRTRDNPGGGRGDGYEGATWWNPRLLA